MEKKDESVKKDECQFEKGKEKWHRNYQGGMGGGFYGLGFLAAAVYYIQHAGTFWMGVLGVLKALVWPAMLIYEIFSKLNM